MIDKSKMKTATGNFITQGIFLELGYKDSAIYTLKDEDYEFKGKTLPSIKRLYLELEDAVEYDFATKYLCGWGHWQRMINNKLISPHIEEWREELELKLRSRALKQILDTADTEQGMAAKKWIADKGWSKREPGRPSKADQMQEKKYKAKMMGEYSQDVARIGV